MINLKPIFSLILIAALGACSPGLDRHLDISGVSENQLAASSDYKNINVRLDGIIDERENFIIGKWGEESLSPDRNTSEVVTNAFSRVMQNYGYNLSNSSYPSVSGEILDWFVEVDQGFPMVTANARAKLRLNIAGPGNKLIYRSIYLAESTKKSPFMSQAHIESILAEAMFSAIQEAFKDPELEQKLQENLS